YSFFFQAEDGIRDFHVTGVQTCALPISILAGASLWALSIVARESMGLMGDLPFVAEISLSLLPLLLTGSGFSALFFMVPNRSVQIGRASCREGVERAAVGA